ncbi:S-methyl-5'-thioadenosine phosphorylase-like [Amphiura filiformis]|uniref:S-methyl-5'-thioadenosine phosphorylase-like n=1 Tax=Amphiura filiformis TaxID=82378 RepID=UPI003B21EE81
MLFRCVNALQASSVFKHTFKGKHNFTTRVNMPKVKIGIIGGTGFEEPHILQSKTEKFVDTPWGKPSDSLSIGQIQGVDCVVIPRHGRRHTIMPSLVNYRANVWALKQEGCTHIVATTAVGSLQEHIGVGDIVVLDQFIDRTTKRHQTYHDGTENGLPGICHIAMHTPFCEETRKIIIEAAEETGVKFHKKGTIVAIEGPRFSSRAESHLWRQWKCDLINMTTVPEVVLAKEAGLCYASIAMPTDFDSWNENERFVSLEPLLEAFKKNIENMRKLVVAAIPRIAQKDWTEIIKQNEAEVKGAIMGLPEPEPAR